MHNLNYEFILINYRHIVVMYIHNRANVNFGHDTL
jgi:hypothetical protein